MKQRITKYMVLGAITGAVVLCLYGLLLLRYLPGGVFIPSTSWLDVAWSSILSPTPVMGALLGAVTGYAVAAQEENYDKAAKVCFVAGLLTVAYAGGLQLRGFYALLVFSRNQGESLSSFVAMAAFPMLVSLMSNLVLLWGILLVAAGIYFRRQQRDRAEGIANLYKD